MNICGVSACAIIPKAVLGLVSGCVWHSFLLALPTPSPKLACLYPQGFNSLLNGVQNALIALASNYSSWISELLLRPKVVAINKFPELFVLGLSPWKKFCHHNYPDWGISLKTLLFAHIIKQVSSWSVKAESCLITLQWDFFGLNGYGGIKRVEITTQSIPYMRDISF